MSAPVRVGIVGCGVAGRARARAVRAVSGATLVGVHHGRFAQDLDAPVLSADALLEQAQVVIIASPSHTHADWVRRALGAGCHVVVEYPLARTAEEGRALLQLAALQQRMLHVEHIELLAPTTQWMAAEVERVGWGRACMRFRSQGPPYEDGAVHAWHQVSRLHRIIAALGWPDTMDVHACTGAEIDADLRWADGRELWFQAERRPDVVRGLSWRVEGPGGVRRVEGRSAWWGDKEVDLPSTTLFQDDWRIALGRMAGTATAYVPDRHVLEVLDFASRLGSGTGSGVSVKAR